MINTYFIMEDGRQTGPFSHTELMDKGLEPDALILSPISNDWQSAAYLPEFYEYFHSQGIYYPIASILANFWWRLLAYIIDYILLILLLIAMGVVIVLILKFTNDSFYWNPDDHELQFRLSGVVLFMIYNAGFEATKLQGSIGKIICKLKVVDAGGQKITFANALGRNVAKILSSLVCGMGFLSIFWNKKRQAWHDEIAKTYVIRVI